MLGKKDRRQIQREKTLKNSNEAQDNLVLGDPETVGDRILMSILPRKPEGRQGEGP